MPDDFRAINCIYQWDAIDDPIEFWVAEGCNNVHCCTREIVKVELEKEYSQPKESKNDIKR